MKKYRISALLLAVTLLVSAMVFPAAAVDKPDLFCRNAILVDANYGDVLYDYNAYEKAYPASITKVMTALLTLEALQSGQLTEDTVVTVSEAASHKDFPNESTANLKPGEQLTVKQLLYCLLLPSANDAAKALAETVGGSIDEFVVMMNRKAGELGCQGTHFVNPNGLHNPEHYTTAYDISLMMTAALEHDLFRQIIATPTYTLPATAMSAERLFFNTNGLISNMYYSGYIYDKCIGGKTGSTDEAGRCLVSAAKDGETLLISVILGSGPIEVPGSSALKQGQFTESTKLLKWGLNNFERVTITQGSEPVDKVKVTLSRQADEVMVKPQGSVTRTLPKDLDTSLIEREINLFSEEVAAPVEEGQVLGSMRLSYGGEVYGSLDLVAVTSVERSTLLYYKAQVFNLLRKTEVKLGLIVGLILVVFLVLKLTVFRKSRRYSGSGARRSRTNYRGGFRRRR